MDNMNHDLRSAFFAGLFGALTCNVVLGLGLVSFVTQNADAKIEIEKLLHLETAPSAIPAITDSTGQVNDVVSAVEAANPAVVSIVITKEVPNIEQYYDNSSQSNPFGIFGFPSMQIPQYRQNGTKKEEVGGGSGFMISSDGYLVTNAHVVSDEGADYTVFLNDGNKHTAKVIAKDTVYDVALLKIEATDLPYLEFADSDNAKVGQTVIAIGNALGEYRNTVSVGVISGLSRSVAAATQYGNAETLSGVLQTDAAINPGNSGGPLLDLTGKVVGVNVAASVGNAQSIGFSLPANEVKQTVDSILKNGRVIHAFLGVRYIPINDQVKNDNNLSIDHGVLIVRGQKPSDLAVIPGSPADKAGLVENDILLELNGEQITLDSPLDYLLHKYEVGDTITLHILHDGQENDVKVTLEENKTSATSE